YRDLDGAVAGVVGVARDVTGSKLVQRALAEQNELLLHLNASLERFAWICSHDLREPLRTLVTRVELVEEATSATLEPPLRHAMRRAVEGAHRLRRMLDGILEYSRAGERSLPATCIGAHALALALDALEQLVRERGARVTGGVLPELRWDETQLARVLQ